jgi:hypothetical protein
MSLPYRPATRKRSSDDETIKRKSRTPVREADLNKYERLKQDLLLTGTGRMNCFGNSMLPLLSNPSLNTYLRQADYEVGDIVFCKVRGRYIDAHKVTKKAADRGFLISNNRGYDNGWTREVYGRVIRSEDSHGNVRTF